MIEIPLSQNKTAFIDDEDGEMILRYQWHAIRVNPRRSFYARTCVWCIGRQYWRIRMHNLILPAPDGFVIDRPIIPGFSGYRGVRRDRGLWRARISQNNRDVHLGSFINPAEAAAAYDAAARELHGEFAQLNFPGGA